MTHHNTTHGYTCGGARPPEYKIWEAMLRRCLNKNDAAYNRYGGRGIKVCERWMDFANFREDMGERPEGKSIDRKQNDGDYEPSNCRWATAKQQANNKRTNILVEHDGEIYSLKEFCELKALRYKSIWHRLKAGWPMDKALFTPIRGRND